MAVEEMEREGMLGCMGGLDGWNRGTPEIEKE